MQRSSLSSDKKIFCELMYVVSLESTEEEHL